LHISAGNILLTNSNSFSTSQGIVKFASPTYPAAYAGVEGKTNGVGTNQLDLIFYTAYGAAQEKMRILSNSGNVGIGTTAPNSTLHVVGIVNATQGFAYGLSAARPAAKEGVVWWNVSAGFHCPQWYNSTHWICNTGAATRADPV
ncbi:MAG: hypothetical protein GW865_03565, partial [Candidatus Aenigmarchaeota archaeon]|nr:hypothetical protein [Candidatus Aenigmarchaeota archaeon]